MIIKALHFEDDSMYTVGIYGVTNIEPFYDSTPISTFFYGYDIYVEHVLKYRVPLHAIGVIEYETIEDKEKFEDE